jgi:methanogenic corrinoid protein MtbC1
VADLMRDRGVHRRIELVIGGAPVNADFAREIGASYGYDAANAVDVVDGLLRVRA